jgi:hypothetical protein
VNLNIRVFFDFFSKNQDIPKKIQMEFLTCRDNG